MPLGSDGPKRQELEDAASVVTNCFFLSMYDAKSKRWPVPSSKDLVKLQQQVYDDLAMRYTMGSACLLLAYQGDELVGCVGLEVMPFEDLPVSSPVRVASMAERRPARQRVAYMSNLSVLPEQRKKGLGQRLVTEAERWAQDKLRVNEVILLVSSKNTPAQRLYEQMGYQVVFQDPWALRAVPAAEGSIDRIRVTNLCLARQLCQDASGNVLHEPKQADLWSTLRSAIFPDS